MKINIYAISKSGHNAIFEWLLSGLPYDFDYEVCHFDVFNPRNNVFLTKSGNGSNKTEFLRAENQFSVLEDFDFSKIKVDADLNVLIIRDFLNCYASFHKFIKDNPHFKHLSFFDFGKLWGVYFQEYIGKSNELKNTIVINYNDWVKSKGYRESVSKKVADAGIPIKIMSEPYQTVTKRGKGSSFDGLDFQGNAQGMETLDRYKVAVNDETYLSYIEKYPDNIKGSLEYFGVDINTRNASDQNPTVNFSEQDFLGFFD